MKIIMMLLLLSAYAFAIGANSGVSMGFNDHNIHAGKHFFYRTNQDVTDADTVVRFMFTTPATKKIHARFNMEAEDEFTVELFESAVASNNGTPVTTFNNNRNSTETPELLAYASPTISNEGTLIWKSVINSGKKLSISIGTNYEIIAKSSTNYLFKITKAAAGTHFIEPEFFWFEEP